MTDVIEHLADPWGVILRREALALGIDDRTLARLVRNGALVRLRQGAYAVRGALLAASDVERHLMLCRAVMRQYGDGVALSHASAAVAQGSPSWGLDLASAHITHLSGGGRNGGRIIHHQGECRVGDLRRQDGHWITTPGRTVLDTAATVGVEAALVQVNHFLHQRLTTMSELRALAAAQRHWPHTLTHHPVLLLADERIESPGESRARYLFWTQGLPAPKIQLTILCPDGSRAGRVDFAWPEFGVMLEFDGQIKYRRLRREGESIEQMVVREKMREDLLREVTGWKMIRLVWADLDLPVATAARLRRALRLAG